MQSCMKRKKLIALNKTNGKCAYCGLKFADGDEVTIDHITPRSAGGTNSIDNLFASCRSCNSAKSQGSIEWFRLKTRFKNKYGRSISKETIEFLIDQDLIKKIDLPEYKFYFEVM